MIIAVGSSNPTKIEPVKVCFEKYFGPVDVVGVSIRSAVSEQPMSEEEMYDGARFRAESALRKTPDAAFGVGIEGGLARKSYGWFESSIIVIIDRQERIGVGSSGGIVLPKKIIDRIHEGKNLEEAIDEAFGTKKIGEGIGMFGVMTNGVVTRASGVMHGVAFALSRFLHEDIYDSEK
jgi:inosine/xanthosine triphosphatase